jgi:hypothetical protein
VSVAFDCRDAQNLPRKDPALAGNFFTYRTTALHIPYSTSELFEKDHLDGRPSPGTLAPEHFRVAHKA